MLRPKGDTTLTASNRLQVTQLSVELAVGAKIDRYVVEKRLGAGGMGVVYEAWDTELARAVALKIVRPRGDLAAMQARLRREAKAMARLSHRNVVPVFDIATHDGQLFIAMELVTGDTLRSWVALPRPWRDVVQLFAKAGRGLEAAHAAGLLHRDFKPDNVMVGSGNEPRITDFGLARELDEEGQDPGQISGRNSDLSQITATGSLAGTPAYMAPEQLLQIDSGPKADQFSFCVALFEVIYGERPFPKTSHDTESRIAEIRAGRIIKPAATRGVPARIHAAIVRGLAFDPDKRWPSMRALVSALERGRRRRWRRFSGAVAIAAIAIAASQHGKDPAAAPTCRDVEPNGNDAVTILVCKDEYTRTSDPRAGTNLADALRRIGQLREAATIATELLATPARADALYTLGKVAADEDRVDDAARSLRLASDLHRDQHQWSDAAADLLALADVSTDFADQLVDLQQAVADAQRGAAPKTEAYCHVATARVLSTVGARAGALDELDRAEPLVAMPSDRAWLDFERGNVHQNLGDHELAIRALERARTGAEAATRGIGALSARLNLAYSLIEAGHLAEAASQLKAATALDPDGRRLASRLAVEARLAARENDLSRAAELLEHAIKETSPDATDDLIERGIQRAELALQQGDLAAAEHGARAAIDRIATLRSAHPPVELRSWMITDRRIPYEVLFASLARAGDAAAALIVFDHYRGLDVLAGLAHGEPPRLQRGGFPITDLEHLLPPLQTRPLASPAADTAILDAARSSSLLVLVVARGELWRITAEAGRLQVQRIDTLAALRPLLERLRAAPSDRGAAAALGDLLIPAELARTTLRPLHVVLDEPIAWLPVPALRVGDRRLISARPIVQPARPSDLGCASAPPRPRRNVVLGATSSLGHAAMVQPEATRASLFEVAPGDRLYLALPTETEQLGDTVITRDSRVRALEIAGRGGAPAQVILAMASTGPAGTRSLAMAFLAAGSDQVIATVHPVSKATIQRLADRLDSSGAPDLARALAAIQADDDPHDDDDWLGFAAFGRAICNSRP